MEVSDNEQTLTFNTVVDNLPLGLLIVNRAGDVAYSNTTAKKLFDINDERVSINQLIPSARRNHHDKFVDNYYENATSRMMGGGRDFTVQSLGEKQFPVEIALAPIQWMGEQCVLTLVSDITDRKKIADELTRSNEELDSFAYIASHDLKEPLRGISNYASFLLEDYEQQLDESGQDMLKSLVRLSGKMEQLISDLLTYSRLGRTELAFEPVNIGEVVQDDIVMLTERLIELDVHCEIDTNLPEITCDRVRVLELFRNLITNAMKYNNKADKHVFVGAIEQSDPVVFYVKDNGIGIPLALQNKIFRLFKRLHTQEEYGGGSGIGLTIVKKIIDRHGGKIWVESALDVGTTFYFTLSPNR